MNKPSDESLMKEICRLEGLKNQLSSFNNTPAYAINKAKKGPGRPPKSSPKVNSLKDMDPSKEITLIDIIGILKLLVDKVDSMNHKIDELNQRMEIYEQSAQAQDEKIEFLQHLTKEQDTKIKELEDNIDELNQHHLSNKIVLSDQRSLN